MVGAPASNNGQGAAFIYSSNNTSKSTWEMSLALIGASVPDGVVNFGSSVSTSNSGTIVAVGAPSQSTLGQVLIYWSNLSSSEWSAWGQLSGFKIGDGFGSSLAVGSSIAENGHFEWQQVFLVMGMPQLNTIWIYSWSTFNCSVSSGCVGYNQTVHMPEVSSFGYHVALDHNFPGMFCYGHSHTTFSTYTL